MKSRRTFIIIGVLFILLVGGWGGLYGFAYQLLKVSPKEGAFLATATPRLSVKWIYTPLVKLSKVKVLLDGEEVTSALSLSKKGFEWTPGRNLKEGKHRLQAELDYRFLFPRRLKLDLKFVTDTIPPEITLGGAVDGIIGTPKRKVRLEGATEPRSSLQAIFRRKEITPSNQISQGRFSFKLNSVGPKKNELKMVAKDLAGNKTTKVFQVIYDPTPPEVKSLMPAPGSAVHTSSPKVVVKLFEANSAISQAKLILDGKVVPTAYDGGTQTLTFSPRFYFDGAHKANLEAIDAAGNKVTKEWTFTIDTSKIVIKLSQRRLYFYKRESLISTYPVAVGVSQFPTPQGHFSIVRKRKNPTWVNPGVDWAKNMPGFIPPGPDNPLGQRALDLSVSGIRIHGTPNTGSVGTAASHGCIRMYPWQIEVLFEQTNVGTPVHIEP